MLRLDEIITFYKTNGQEIQCKVTGIRIFDSFDSLVAAYGVAQVLPGYENYEDAVDRVYGKFYQREIAAGFSAVAIELVVY